MCGDGLELWVAEDDLITDVIHSHTIATLTAGLFLMLSESIVMLSAKLIHETTQVFEIEIGGLAGLIVDIFDAIKTVTNGAATCAVVRARFVQIAQCFVSVSSAMVAVSSSRQALGIVDTIWSCIVVGGAFISRRKKRTW